MNITAEDLLKAGYHNARNSWTEAEDQLLTKWAKHGDLSWGEIADHIPNRTPKMCYSRYRRLCTQTKVRWTEDEDNLIKTLIEKYGENWRIISHALESKK